MTATPASPESGAGTPPGLRAVLERHRATGIGRDRYRIRFGAATLDVLLTGFERIRKSRGMFLVGFTGAITNVAVKIPPFFAGQALAGELGAPLVSFSDPTLRDRTLTLGFHAGNAGVADLPAHMGGFLRDIARQFSATALLFGGSGGGFAALNTLGHCNARDIAFVWNPQTCITRYYWKHAMSYVRVAFPDIHRRHEQATVKDRPAVEAELEAAGCPFSVLPWQGKGTVLYFQNQTDRHHVAEHLRPFCAPLAVRRLLGNACRAEGQDVFFHFGAWGEGHAPLPRETVRHVLGALLAGKSPEALLRETGADNGAEGHVALVSDLARGALRPTFARRGDSIVVDARLRGRDVHAVQYAFYLHSGTTRIAIAPYSPDPRFVFDPAGQRDLSVRVFLRDITGAISARSFPCPL